MDSADVNTVRKKERPCDSGMSETLPIRARVSRMLKRDRVWLGVWSCAADEIEMDPNAVRLILILLGLILPILPLLLIVYIGAYFGLRQRIATYEPVQWFRIIKSAASAFGIALALRLGSTWCLDLINRLVGRMLNMAPSISDDWAWLDSRGGALFFWALAFCLPLAMLATMPVPQDWSSTLRKVWQALLAIYAVTICFGIASYLTGLVLFLAREMPGSPIFSEFM